VIFFDFPGGGRGFDPDSGWVFFSRPKVDTIIQKLGSCSHLWVSRNRRWFINQGVPGSNPGGYLFFPPKFRGALFGVISFRGVSPVYFPLVNFIPWRVSGHFGRTRSLRKLGLLGSFLLQTPMISAILSTCTKITPPAAV